MKKTIAVLLLAIAIPACALAGSREIPPPAVFKWIDGLSPTIDKPMVMEREWRINLSTFGFESIFGVLDTVPMSDGGLMVKANVSMRDGSFPHVFIRISEEGKLLWFKKQDDIFKSSSNVYHASAADGNVLIYRFPSEWDYDRLKNHNFHEINKLDKNGRLLARTRHAVKIDKFIMYTFPLEDGGVLTMAIDKEEPRRYIVTMYSTGLDSMWQKSGKLSRKIMRVDMSRDGRLIATVGEGENKKYYTFNEKKGRFTAGKEEFRAYFNHGKGDCRKGVITQERSNTNYSYGPSSNPKAYAAYIGTSQGTFCRTMGGGMLHITDPRNGSLLFSSYSTRSIRDVVREAALPEIVKWYKRGEFEKSEVYSARVTPESTRKKMNRVASEKLASLAKEYIRMHNIRFTSASYDPDAEVMKLESSQFPAMYMKVKVDWARDAKKAFDRRYVLSKAFKVNYSLVGDKLLITKLYTDYGTFDITSPVTFKSEQIEPLYAKAELDMVESVFGADKEKFGL